MFPVKEEVVADTCCSHSTAEIKQEVEKVNLSPYFPAFISLLLLLTGIALQHWVQIPVHPLVVFAIFLTAYITVGWKTIWKAITSIPTANIFNEFFLMTIATLGAFAIGEYAEGVAVMLFYEVGELFNSSAVKRAKKSIKALLDMRPAAVTMLRNGKTTLVDPKAVKPGEIIQTRPGERVALDGQLLSQTAQLNTAALTGESRPATFRQGDKILAGMINLHSPLDIQVTHAYEDSALARILVMVQNALSRKARTERFISRFAKIYTPIVVLLAVCLVGLPYFFVANYQFSDWLYRALVFLVISCPCALVISIPLGYFGGIGAASRNGILFKGSHFLDLLTKVDTVVMDKTGTLTKGVFEVQTVKTAGIEKPLFLKLAASLENISTHPVARAVAAYGKEYICQTCVSFAEEIPGYGMRGTIDDYEVLAGNTALMKKFNIAYDPQIDKIAESVVIIAVNGTYKGYLVIADELKPDAAVAIENLRRQGITKTVLLSGDRKGIVKQVAAALKIDEAYGELLPEDKVTKLELLKKQKRTIAFIGDGVNDAPVVALADIGMAMGGLGSDATIETADVVIQTDQPSKVATAIQIGKTTRQIVWQNIALAFGVKLIVLALGAWGVASLWEAVFADVGVALLAILNAVRIQKMQF